MECIRDCIQGGRGRQLPELGQRKGPASNIMIPATKHWDPSDWENASFLRLPPQSPLDRPLLHPEEYIQDDFIKKMASRKHKSQFRFTKDFTKHWLNTWPIPLDLRQGPACPPLSGWLLIRAQEAYMGYMMRTFKIVMLMLYRHITYWWSQYSDEEKLEMLVEDQEELDEIMMERRSIRENEQEENQVIDLLLLESPGSRTQKKWRIPSSPQNLQNDMEEKQLVWLLTDAESRPVTRATSEDVAYPKMPA
ncbi:hypothetical protein C8J56DRAFT_894956 [Mycena floridula]|nr:hypothetical protein C8J56DRAFT_894956 [Mycena floridula]